MTTTLVVGATGLVGSQVVNTLLSRGERVRILARPGADIAAAPAGASFVPVWESGATKKVSVTNLLSDAGDTFAYADRFDNSSSTKTN